MDPWTPRYGGSVDSLPHFSTFDSDEGLLISLFHYLFGQIGTPSRGPAPVPLRKIRGTAIEDTLLRCINIHIVSSEGGQDISAGICLEHTKHSEGAYEDRGKN